MVMVVVLEKPQSSLGWQRRSKSDVRAPLVTLNGGKLANVTLMLKEEANQCMARVKESKDSKQGTRLSKMNPPAYASICF